MEIDVKVATKAVPRIGLLLSWNRPSSASSITNRGFWPNLPGTGMKYMAIKRI